MASDITYYSTFLNLDNYDDDSDNVHEEELIAIKKKLKINPCLHNFKGYRDEKMKICEDNGFIFKEVLQPGYGEKVDIDEHKIQYKYDFYLEDNEEPFDSNLLTKKYGVLHLEANEYNLLGIQLAIATMKYDETALFWISHEYMFGTFGLGDIIPPKADIIARIKIAKMFSKDGRKEIKPMMSGFECAIQSAKHSISEGKLCFQKGDYINAIEKYNNVIFKLENLHLAHDDEENEQKKFLIKIYLNLCICYNKNKNPQQTCLKMKQLERLTSIEDNVKALYTKARALIMLDDFKRATDILRQALKVDPGNKSILGALKEIEDRSKIKRNFAHEIREMEAEIFKENLADNFGN